VRGEVSLSGGESRSVPREKSPTSRKEREKWGTLFVKAGKIDVRHPPVFLFNIADHISATGVGVYVRQNKEPSGRRSSPSLECSLLPGLRVHQQQSRWRMRCLQKPLAREPGSDARG